MKAPHELIIFDCDGVVVDSEPIGNRVFRGFLAELGLDLSEQEVYDRFLGRSLADSLALVEALIGRAVPRDDVERYRQRRDRAMIAEVRAVDGIAELVRDLDVPYCIASAGDHDKMRATLGATGLWPLFEGRIFSATEVPRAKPAPDVFLHAAAVMGVAPERTAVVEDTVNGVTAAHAAGMTIYGYASLTPADKLLAAGASTVFTSMRELRDLLRSR